ncbi:MAG: hypothetical protein RBT16_06450, partial [Desulfococcus multivorans]|nr:hypothetical protein [Desulfococcus multivorans]
FPKNRLSFINSTFDFHDGDRKEVPGGYGPSPLNETAWGAGRSLPAPAYESRKLSYKKFNFRYL